MSDLVLTDAQIWLGQYDLTGHSNQVSLQTEVELQDSTRMGDSTRRNMPGLVTVASQIEGIWNVTPDAGLYAKVGLADVPITISPDTGVDGDLAYFFKAVIGDYAPGANVGELLRFSAGGHARGAPLVRGTILGNTTYTVTANGTGRQLGAVASGQDLYCALHVLTVGGSTPTLDVTIESDGDNTFSAPTTRATFAQKTAAGFEVLAGVAGPITDDWFRAVFTLGGTSPSFAAVAVVGIK